ncbi:MAG: hypothetical protein GY772_25545 [bacterium]|nr:hypothetical protein [bacterium]
MTAEEFAKTPEKFGISRRELCRQIGISKRSGDAYAAGHSPVPRTVQLAILALEAGLHKSLDEETEKHD